MDRIQGRCGRRWGVLALLTSFLLLQAEQRRYEPHSFLPMILLCRPFQPPTENMNLAFMGSTQVKRSSIQNKYFSLLKYFIYRITNLCLVIQYDMNVPPVTSESINKMKTRRGIEKAKFVGKQILLILSCVKNDQRWRLSGVELRLCLYLSDILSLCCLMLRPVADTPRHGKVNGGQMGVQDKTRWLWLIGARGRMPRSDGLMAVPHAREEEKATMR